MHYFKICLLNLIPYLGETTQGSPVSCVVPGNIFVMLAQGVD